MSDSIYITVDANNRSGEVLTPRNFKLKALKIQYGITRNRSIETYDHKSEWAILGVLSCTIVQSDDILHSAQRKWFKIEFHNKINKLEQP